MDKWFKDKSGKQLKVGDNVRLAPPLNQGFDALAGRVATIVKFIGLGSMELKTSDPEILAEAKAKGGSNTFQCQAQYVALID